jgi:hypothetical protein
MSSVAYDLVQEVAGRLRAANLVKVVRIDHRTRVPLEDCPRIHVVEGDEVPGDMKGCAQSATKDVVVRIFTRNDSSAELDALRVSAMTALDPATAYPHKATVKPGRIQPIQEIADNDSNRCDMAFRFSYLRGEFSLEEP